MLLLQLLVDLSWIWIPLLLIFLLTRGRKSGPDRLYEQNAQRDQMWRDYLASFQQAVKTSKEKQLLETLIQGRTAAEFTGVLPSMQSVAQAEVLSHSQLVESGSELAAVEALAAEMPAKIAQPIDSTILLLYFGAFLLVASVGLFVAIGGLGGLARTTIVAITAGVLYFGGFWLQAVNKKLAQAGISFVGTGMIIAPLTGVAWYNLVSGQSDAGLVWLLTSFACAALYVHAFGRIKNDFIAYLLIGSFVSSIESAVLTINLPAYGYAWGLIAAALLLAVNGRLRSQTLELSRAADTSSQLLIPLSVLGSIALLPHYGSIQLAITLFLSGVYYSLMTLWRTEDRQPLGIAAQVSYIAGLVSAVYAIQKTPLDVGITLITVAALYGVALVYARREVIQKYRLIEIAGVSNALALVLCLGSAWSLVTGFGVAIILAAIVWQKLQNDEAFQLAGLLLVGLPFLAGQYALQDKVGSWLQLSLCTGSAALLGIVVIAASRHSALNRYYSTASVLYILGTLALLVPARPLGFATLSSTVLVIIASFVYLRYLSKNSNWLVSSAVIAFVPLLYALFGFGVDDGRFSASVAVVLLWNISISLVTRQALVRWLVVSCLLIAPIAIGGGGLGLHWGPAGYAAGYLLAMAACLAARTIARGKLLVSAKVPIASYYREASQAYVAGYTAAGALSIVISLFDDHSQIVTTVILGLIAVAITVIARIERNNQLLALLPFVMQGLLFSGIRPDLSNATAVGITAVVLSLAAAGAYGVALLLSSADSKAVQSARMASVAAAYIGPALVLTQTSPSLLLPGSLFIAGLLTYDFNRAAKQEAKELSLAVGIVSIHWLLFLIGYTNIHVHTHLLAVFLAGFAYWRNLLGNAKASESYIQALFFIVTVPLALQSLSGESGGLYGLLLIGEQACFMLAGASFGQRFLLHWGLWTALAAILFQLRGLGWAFLSLLALIVIGVAVYRLQKHPPE